MPAAGVPALALEEERRLVIDLLRDLMDLARIEPCIPYLPTEMQSSCAAYLSALVSPALSLLEGKVSVAAFLLKQLERAVNPARQVRALGQKWESRHEQCSAHQVVAQRRWFGRRGRRRGGRRRHGLRQIVDRSWLGRSWLRPRQHGRLRRLEQLLALSQPARPRLDACLSRCACGARSCVISGCWII